MRLPDLDIEILKKPLYRDHPGDRKMYEAVGDSTLRIDDCVCRIESGFRYDGSSVPRPLRWLVDSDDMGLLAPLWHDKLFRDGGWMWCYTRGKWVHFSRIESDTIYSEVCRLEGGIEWKRRAAYSGLILGSWTRWKPTELPPTDYRRLSLT